MTEQKIEEQLNKQQSQLLDVAKAVAGHHVLFDKVENITGDLQTIVKLQQSRLDKLSTKIDCVQKRTNRVNNHMVWYFVIMAILSTICFYVAWFY